MSLIYVEHNPKTRTLNWFGVAWLVFISLLGAQLYRKTGVLPAAMAVWAAAVIVPVVGWCWTAFMRIVYVGMCYAVLPIGFVVSLAVLALTYFLVITPIGWIMRACRYDPMTRRPDPEARTYWIDHEETKDPGRYFRQF